MSKRYIQTKFIEFVTERKERKKENTEEENDKIVTDDEVDDEEKDEVETDDLKDNDDDSVINELMVEYEKIRRKYEDDKIYFKRQ